MGAAMAPQGTEPKDSADDDALIKFMLNGVQKSVSPVVVPLDTRLVDYLRYNEHLTGTKMMCREGGCGACIVVATVPDGAGGGTKSFSVQACQLLVYACSGWSIETIEHLGTRYSSKGYHPLQMALAGFYGTQCGYCSPGMVMTMYGEEKRTGSMTQDQVEKALDGNICRCTGYRPILDAFKSRAVDAPPKLKQQLADIEDAFKVVCPSSGAPCRSQCSGGGGSCGSKTIAQPTEDILVSSSSTRWFRPVTLQGVYNAIKTVTPNEKMLLVSGNTGAGVFKYDGPYNVFISVDGVKELHEVQSGRAPLKLGSRVSLTKGIEVFRQAAATVPGYKHLKEIADHWQVIANLAVRNNGTWAGNLVMKNRHKDFPSDIFLTLSVCDATVTIADAVTGATKEVKVIDILNTDLTNAVMLSVTIPPFEDATTFVRTFKITPRAVNAHAYINAAIKINTSAENGFSIKEKPTILFGGLGAQFVSATKTEQYLMGKTLTDAAVIAGAAAQLAQEVVPSDDPHQGSAAYRKSLVQALLYKTVLWILQGTVPQSLKSGAEKLVRSLNKGQQDFDANTDTWPIGEAIPKIESKIQISGEAEYGDDVPVLPGELHGVFVQTTHANARIDSVDATKALAMPGVVDFITAADIPGVNTYVSGEVTQTKILDKVFATDRSEYHGQPVGLIVARDRQTARVAAKMVTVRHSDMRKPILTIKEAIKHGKVDTKSILDEPRNSAVEKDESDVTSGEVSAAPHNIKGEIDVPTQYHFPMELYFARVAPMEDGYDVLLTSQWINEAQVVLGKVMNLPANSFNMSVRRLGGGYGSKLTRSNLVACAAAVAAAKTKRPVRITLDLEAQMTLVGWREPYYATYDVGFNNDGLISMANVTLYSDSGHASNDSSIETAAVGLRSVYDWDKIKVTPHVVNTNTAANTWCRTPGHVEGIAVMENIIERIAETLKMDPLQVRTINMAKNGAPLGTDNVFKTTILPLLKEKAMLDQRKAEVEQFNKTNRWTKRGLSVVPLKYPFPYVPPLRYSAHVIIYEQDGTIAITHGGIEMGQGINTKVVQVAASSLSVPMSLIKIKPTTNIAGANSVFTGGSYASDLVCHATKICCDNLKKRIDEVKNTLPDPQPAWPQLIKICLNKDVDLSERFWSAWPTHPKSYNIWAGAAVEVEIDVLTGQNITRRVDIIEDAGRSMSPFVDIGQVEGAYIMGQGLFTSEVLRYDPNTGQKLVTGTWEYKPPTALDIPADFRVTLLPNASNPNGVLRSKATGEPPLCLSYAVVTALRQAIAAAREQAGVPGWFDMLLPATVENIQQMCLVDASQFTLS